MKRIEVETCERCGGIFRAIGHIRYPVYDGPNPCTCADPPSEDDDTDANVTGFDVVRRATEGR